MSLRDLALAFRTLRKNPVFASTAILTIALGVGASTAIFSVANAVLLRPLPYKNASHLVNIMSDMRARNVRDFPISAENYIDLHNATKDEFEDTAAVFTGRVVSQAADGTSEQLRLAVATTNFFQLVGARIALGRDFNDADGVPQAEPPPGAKPEEVQRAPLTAILSYEYFQRRYGANPAVLETLTPDRGARIVGVLAPHFKLYFPAAADTEPEPEMWFANRLRYDNANRNGVSLHVIGRLKNGVTVERAQAACDAVAAELRKNFIIYNTANLVFRVEPMGRHLVDEVRPAILALMGAVIFLLLIACANVANLLLVRASLRERELAVRTAIGATWWDLAQQVLTEAFLLAAIGAAAGLGLAWLGIHELRVLAPANLPRLDSIRIDMPVLIFTALAGMLAGGIFGFASAWRASRLEVTSALKGGTRNEGLARGGRSRKMVVIAEVALSFVLLIGSGLMFRSFLELQRVNPGFDAHGLLKFQVLGAFGGEKPEQRLALTKEIQSRLLGIAGVQSATATFPFPLSGGFLPVRWGPAEAKSDPSKFQAVDYQTVIPGYFATMRTPILEGRAFTEDDNRVGTHLIIVDDVLAAKAFPGQSAVGKKILVRVFTPEAEWMEIVGVAAHQREESLVERGREQMYVPDAYFEYGFARVWVIRTSGDPARFGKDVRAAMKVLDGHYSIGEMRTADSLVTEAEASTRFSLLLIGVFAVVAALLAGVGLYGVLATVVRQRTAEIGVRMALGAGSRNIFNLIVGQGLALAIVGIAVGCLGALALTRAMTTMLVGVKPTDPITFVTMAVIFFVVAGIASWIPARRAAGVDPAIALRDE